MGQLLSRATGGIFKRSSKKRKQISPVKSSPSQSVNKDESLRSINTSHYESYTIIGDDHSLGIPKVSARPPLHSVRGSSLNQDVSPAQQPPPHKRKKSQPIEEYLDFPLLKNCYTMEYVYKSKIMVILRGISGSGKSTIGRSLKAKYPEAVVCSADDYFMKDGEYEFKFDELRFAHEACQTKAREAAEAEVNLIVIDNTNVKLWEMKYYIHLAKDQGYTVVIYEPQTPWSMDPMQLVSRSTHGVSEDVLIQKVKQFQEIKPLFYGWFLNEADSVALINLGRHWLRQALQVPQVFNDLSQLTHLKQLEDILQYFSRDKLSGNKNIAHCTAKYTGKGKAEGAMEYIENPFVKSSVSQTFDLRVIGFTITSKTIGARVMLSEHQLELWGQNDTEEPPEVVKLVQSSHGMHKNNKSNIIHKNDSQTLNQNKDKDDAVLQANHIENSKGNVIHTTNDGMNGTNDNDITNGTNDNDVVNGTNDNDVINGNNDSDITNGTNDNNIINGNNDNIVNSNNEGEIQSDGHVTLNETFEVAPSKNKDNEEEITESTEKLISNIINGTIDETNTNHNMNGNEIIDEINCDSTDTVMNNSNKQQSGDVSIADEILVVTNCQETLELVPQHFGKDRFCPTNGLGSRAHITIDTAPNITPVTTGFDTISVVSSEQKVKECELTGEIENCQPSTSSYTLLGGIIKKYGNDTWVVYPDKAAFMSTMFSYQP